MQRLKQISLNRWQRKWPITDGYFRDKKTKSAKVISSEGVKDAVAGRTEWQSQEKDFFLNPSRL